MKEQIQKQFQQMLNKMTFEELKTLLLSWYGVELVTMVLMTMEKKYPKEMEEWSNKNEF